MMAQSSLFAVLAPAVPGREGEPVMPDHPGATAAPTQSFSSVMSQIHHEVSPKSSGEPKTPGNEESSKETSKPPVESPDLDSSAASTLVAPMAPPQLAAGEFRKLTFASALDVET